MKHHRQPGQISDGCRDVKTNQTKASSSGLTNPFTNSEQDNLQRKAFTEHELMGSQRGHGFLKRFLKPFVHKAQWKVQLVHKNLKISKLTTTTKKIRPDFKKILEETIIEKRVFNKHPGVKSGYFPYDPSPYSMYFVSVVTQLSHN